MKTPPFYIFKAVCTVKKIKMKNHKKDIDKSGKSVYYLGIK
ncbi:hypothetical protein CHK_1642 [Christensenella hongkongensis]|uniref:Uncharacterized protein n=1 Tax=Christensenella hongkongensis TaxID=270498 RepID=A0A0M2NKV3_9FIRM|nr:hypothetical protein CHK_1642 [Christensenella hongkongensis]